MSRLRESGAGLFVESPRLEKVDMLAPKLPRYGWRPASRLREFNGGMREDALPAGERRVILRFIGICGGVIAHPFSEEWDASSRWIHCDDD